MINFGVDVDLQKNQLGAPIDLPLRGTAPALFPEKNGGQMGECTR
jgi:hypothetical protein